MKPGGVLEEILARTRQRVKERREAVPLDRLAVHAFTPTGRRDFAAALVRPEVNVIAEFKRRSPAHGVLREDAVAGQVAQAYEVAGAAALSVLTEEHFFDGSLHDLREARQSTLLPALRKDFVVDPYQVWESLYMGADALLLIVAALSDAELSALWDTTREAGLAALFEVHDQEDLDRALRLSPRIVGINNRDLRTLAVDLQTALDLVRQVPDDVIAVAESGIRTPEDVRRLRAAGIDAFLVGEHLMRAADPGEALERLIRESGGPAGKGRVVVPSQHRTAVKICGITSVEDGRAAALAGADAIGLVFWPKSPRRVDVDTARAIARALPPFVLRVGVFVDAGEDEIRRTADAVGLDLVQLHGDETPEAVARAPRRALKALRVGAEAIADEARRYAGAAAGLLLDTRTDGFPGGTGQAFDWSRAQEARAVTSFLVLAGGLTPENVGEAVRAARPDAVDVSSGVESAPGRKDAAKVRAFVEAVRRSER